MEENPFLEKGSDAEEEEAGVAENDDDDEEDAEMSEEGVEQTKQAQNENVKRKKEEKKQDKKEKISKNEQLEETNELEMQEDLIQSYEEYLKARKEQTDNVEFARDEALMIEEMQIQADQYFSQNLGAFDYNKGKLILRSLY